MRKILIVSLLLLGSCADAQLLYKVGNLVTVRYEVTDFTSINEKSKLLSDKIASKECDGKYVELFDKNIEICTPTFWKKYPGLEMDSCIPYNDITYMCL
jgi:hypothetical protein